MDMFEIDPRMQKIARLIHAVRRATLLHNGASPIFLVLSKMDEANAEVFPATPIVGDHEDFRLSGAILRIYLTPLDGIGNNPEAVVLIAEANVQITDAHFVIDLTPIHPDPPEKRDHVVVFFYDRPTKRGGFVVMQYLRDEVGIITAVNYRAVGEIVSGLPDNDILKEFAHGLFDGDLP